MLKYTTTKTKQKSYLNYRGADFLSTDEII